MHKAALKLGTRGSPLALEQARQVAAALRAAHGWPAEAVEIVPVKTTGDRVADRPVAEIGGKAVWTKELDRALLAGDIDFAVHSTKDIESVRPPEIALAATLPRADVRDRLIGAAGLSALKPGMRVGTSSPRRAAQILACCPGVSIVPFRGNVARRLERLQAGEADATLLAGAGLERLGLDIGTAVPRAEMLCAPGQGAIGIECRAADEEVRSLLAPIDHAPTMTAITAERAFARGLGGSCHTPVAALAEEQGGGYVLRGEILSEDGSERVADSITFAADEAERAGAALAGTLLGRASPALRRLFAGD
jgi:hydroxymethylbilane synthase